MENIAPQPFSEHLRELRARALWCLLALLVGTGIGYFLHGSLLTLLVQPLNQPLYFSSPAGGFEFILQVCLFFGLLVAAPVTLYHTVRFVEPVLPRRSRRFIVKLLVASSLLLVAGISFAYFISLPAALHFLSLFGVAEVEALITTTAYLTFATRYILGFALLFQLPLILLLINSVTRLSTKTLLSKQKWLVLSSFTFAAILTPTFDILNQLLFALPIILLYQLSIGLLWLTNRNAKQARGDRGRERIHEGSA